jgi:hypothetical protein
MNGNEAIQWLYLGTDGSRWLSLGAAARYLDVDESTINRRALPWQDAPVPGKLRWKLLKLGDDTRKERRYVIDDLNSLLVLA